MGFKTILGDRKFKDTAIYKHDTRNDTINKHVKENQDILNSRTYYISTIDMPNNLLDLKLNNKDRVIISTPAGVRDLTLIVSK